jgi:hypothetical protein
MLLVDCVLDPNATLTFMFRIRDMLVPVWIRIRIRILGSVPSANGHGSGSFSFSSVRFKLPTNYFFLSFYAYSFPKVQLHYTLKIKKSHEEVTKSRNQGFSSFVCLSVEGCIRIQSRIQSWGLSMQINYGSRSGSRRSKNIQILRFGYPDPVTLLDILC